MEKIIDKHNKIRKIYVLLVSIYILIQPFLDIYRSLTKIEFEIFNISIIEIVNLLLIGSIVGVTSILNKSKINKNNTKKLIVFAFVIIAYMIYLLLHTTNIMNFNTSLFPAHKLNAFVEIYYIFRALLEPLILMLCIYINGFSKKAFYTIITILTLIISGLIVISNIFKFSLVAYSDTNKLILDNLFSWFSFTGTYVSPLTSKGLYFSANQLSNLLVILLPINIANFTTKKNILSFIVIPIQFLSMLMIGTKTATIGSIGIIIGHIFLTLIISIKNRKEIKKEIKQFIIISVMMIIFIPIIVYSPLFLKYRNNKIFSKPIQEQTTTTTTTTKPITTTKPSNEPIIEKPSTPPVNNQNLIIENMDCAKINEETIKLLKNEHSNYNISKDYIEKYSIENDPEFWCNMLKKQYIERQGNRVVKTQIFSRIKELNNNKLDDYFGLGYTLNMLNTETDYYMNYYQFGLLGLILLIGPYWYILITLIIKFFRKFKKNFTYENILILVSIFCGIVSPHFSGHLFGHLFVTLPLSIITIMGYNIFKEDEK